MTSRRDPFDEIERTLERLTQQLDTDIGGFADRYAGPAVDIAESESEYTVVVDLPGYEREGITVTASDDSLTVRAERHEEQEFADGELLRQERTHSEVRREVALPGPVEEADASAGYQNGVLTVTLPKRHGSEGGETIEVE